MNLQVMRGPAMRFACISLAALLCTAPPVSADEGSIQWKTYRDVSYPEDSEISCAMLRDEIATINDDLDQLADAYQALDDEATLAVSQSTTAPGMANFFKDASIVAVTEEVREYQGQVEASERVAQARRAHLQSLLSSCDKPSPAEIEKNHETENEFDKMLQQKP